MSEDFNMEKVIPFLFCAQFGSNFDIECAKVLETGSDTVIIKVVCKGCGKKYALAFMDLTFPMFAQSLDDTDLGSDNICAAEFSKDNEDFKDTAKLDDEHCFEDENFACISEKHKMAKNLGKITYDDVLEAHDFIQNFEENWRRYLDRRKYNTI